MTAGYVLLEDGTRFDGELCGDREARSTGEVVFNTSMTGYQEAVTDPSYAGQIITFTYPLIGNYGVSRRGDGVRPRPRPRRDHARGARTARTPPTPRAAGSTGCATAASRRSRGVDTRALVRHIRDRGAMRGGIFSGRDRPRPRRASGSPPSPRWTAPTSPAR